MSLPTSVSHSVPYGTLLSYSPRGSGEISVRSRDVCYAIKNDSAGMIGKAVRELLKHTPEIFSEFFDNDTELVPVPRSSPLTEGALWPSLEICNAVKEAGLAASVQPYLNRVSRVTKSASAAVGNRPGAPEHFESIASSRMGDVLPRNLLLVDDVITRGDTIMGCAARLRESFPNATVRAFGLVRTKGFVPEVEKILEPCTGEISWTGRDCRREP